ncbi:hypothetical protein JW756_00020 [Candidatus Woesearchaeota archaeon]|nr:hypothetical protein [Candidatus Woesearchaeota archaeon]
MVKKIEYIECECGQGKLEKIASTKPLGGKLDERQKKNYEDYEANLNPVMPFQLSIFYACDKCNKIYQEDRIVYFGRREIPQPRVERVNLGGVIEERTYNLPAEYKGRLSREHLEKSIRYVEGFLRSEKEENVLRF